MIVIGLGNPDRGDDAAGLVVARRLAAARSRSVLALESAGDLVSLMEAWRDQDHVLVVDATRGAGPAGTIRRFEGGETSLPASLRHASTHALGLAAAVELARVLRRLPARLAVYGIEGSCFEPGAPLSPPVARAVQTVVSRILREAHAADGVPAA